MKLMTALVLLATQNGVLSAQDASKKEPKTRVPLVVESETDKVDGGTRHKTLQVRHIGDKPILAYVLRYVVKSDASDVGKPLSTTCSMAATGLTPNSRLPWQPGESIQEQTTTPADGSAVQT